MEQGCTGLVGFCQGVILKFQSQSSGGWSGGSSQLPRQWDCRHRSVTPQLKAAPGGETSPTPGCVSTTKEYSVFLCCRKNASQSHLVLSSNTGAWRIKLHPAHRLGDSALTQSDAGFAVCCMPLGKCSCYFPKSFIRKQSQSLFIPGAVASYLPASSSSGRAPARQVLLFGTEASCLSVCERLPVLGRCLQAHQVSWGQTQLLRNLWFCSHTVLLENCRSVFECGDFA